AYLDWAAGRNRPSSIALDRQRLRCHILPKLGALPISSVTRPQVRELINDLGKRHPVTANRVAAIITKLFGFARNELDLPVQDPASGLRSQFPEASRTRVLTDEEFSSLWVALEGGDTPVSRSMALCIQLCALTLQRGQEVAGLDRAELDFTQKLWVIPAART